jgi:hypothetical protein
MRQEHGWKGKEKEMGKQKDEMRRNSLLIQPREIGVIVAYGINSLANTLSNSTHISRTHFSHPSLVSLTQYLHSRRVQERPSQPQQGRCHQALDSASPQDRHGARHFAKKSCSKEKTRADGKRSILNETGRAGNHVQNCTYISRTAS